MNKYRLLVSFTRTSTSPRLQGFLGRMSLVDQRCLLSTKNDEEQQQFGVKSQEMVDGGKCDDDVNRVKRPEHMELTKGMKRSQKRLKARILDIQQLSPSIKGFTLDIINWEKGDSFKAGQWVDLKIDSVSQIGGYSFCCPPETLEEKKQVSLAVKRSNWPPAKWLHNQAVEGDLVEMAIGGNFHYPNCISEKMLNHNVLLIAGGVGINPIISIFKHLKNRKDKGTAKHCNTRLLYSAKDTPDLIFKEQIDEIVSKDSSTSVKYFLTSVSNDKEDCFSDSKDTEYSRMKKWDLKKSIEEIGIETHLLCFICGPQTMVEEVKMMLLDLGVPEEHVFYEIW